MQSAQDKIEHWIKTRRVVLFMKGSPEFPKCGYSQSVADILNHLGVHYLAVDVLEDPDVREGIKEFSQWPTIPQLYVDGKFIGGCDIVVEMYRDASLAKLLDIS